MVHLWWVPELHHANITEFDVDRFEGAAFFAFIFNVNPRNRFPTTRPSIKFSSKTFSVSDEKVFRFSAWNNRTVSWYRCVPHKSVNNRRSRRDKKRESFVEPASNGKQKKLSFEEAQMSFGLWSTMGNLSAFDWFCGRGTWRAWGAAVVRRLVAFH